MLNLSPEIAAQRLAEYHQKQTERQKQQLEIEKQTAELRADIQAYVKKHHKPETVTVHGDKTCAECGHVIPDKTRAKTRSDKIGYGFPEGIHWRTYYWHLGCVGAKQ